MPPTFAENREFILLSDHTTTRSAEWHWKLSLNREYLQRDYERQWQEIPRLRSE
jgi:hypothetical protein